MVRIDNTRTVGVGRMPRPQRRSAQEAMRVSPLFLLFLVVVIATGVLLVVSLGKAAAAGDRLLRDEQDN